MPPAVLGGSALGTRLGRAEQRGNASIAPPGGGHRPARDEGFMGYKERQCRRQSRAAASAFKGVHELQFLSPTALWIYI